MAAATSAAVGDTTESPTRRRTVHYRGRTRGGTNVSGLKVVDDLAKWVEKRFRQGDRWLHVTEPPSRTVIAAVLPADNYGPRCWWSEP